MYNLDRLKIYTKTFGNIKNFLYICENFTKDLGVTIMMGYNIMLQYRTKADSFGKNNILATYNVFTENLGKGKGAR